MSSTNRGAERMPYDYYRTPEWCIENAIECFSELENLPLQPFILDPACGGDADNAAAYPTVLKRLIPRSVVVTLDIRLDSRANQVIDYLEDYMPDFSFDAVITNPPYNLAMEFLKKGLNNVKERGFVILLLRLSFFATNDRKPFLQANMPKYQIISSRRPSFMKGGSDSADYAHFVWQKGYNPDHTLTYLV